MGERDGQVDREHIGTYLRSVRESRRLSLDAVVEMTGALPGRVTKSYLSRMENGKLEPTFARLYALSQVYGVPIASLAERFEVDLRTRSRSNEFAREPVERLVKDAKQLIQECHFSEALPRIETTLFRVDLRELQPDELCVGVDLLRIWRVVCLIRLERLHAAKDECEDLLAGPKTSRADKALALFHFARCCFRMGKMPLALMAVDVLEGKLSEIDSKVLSPANLISLKGNILYVMEDFGGARDAFRKALGLFDDAGDTFSACRHRINYGTSLADCGKPREARKQLMLALSVARKARYARQEAFALHGLGKMNFQINDLHRAESQLLESNRVARERQYVSLVFCNCYYLMLIARSRGETTLASAHRRTLQSYLSRATPTLVEVLAFRVMEQGGGE